MSPTDDKRLATRRRAARSMVLVCAMFCLMVAGLLVWEWSGAEGADPWESPRFQQLRAELDRTPGDGELRERIREADLRLRREFFRRQAFMRRGGWLLAGGVAALLISAHVAASGRPVKVPGGSGDLSRREIARRKTARWSIGAASIALAAAITALALVSPDPLARRVAPEEPEPVAGVDTEDEPAPEAVEVSADWPRFRGPGGLGVAPDGDFPDDWDGESGRNILWKSEQIPLPGHNSPVVAGHRVFITGADAENRELYCYNADTGELLWRHRAVNIPGARPDAPSVMDDTGYAAPSPATDGRYVVAVFANGDVICTDMEGERAWARNLGPPDNIYGHASSPIIHGDKVIIQYDQGTDPEAMYSELYGLDLETGSVRYLKERPVMNSWSTPLVADTPDGEQLITTSSPWVIAYDPADGGEIWRADCLTGDVGPSPTYADGKVYAVTAYSQLSAIRTGGEGDVTDTHIEWIAYDDLPDIVSPLATDDRIWLVQTYGLMTCLDAETGDMIYEHDFDSTVRSSPTLVGDEVHLLTSDGVMHRFSATADEYDELGTADLSERSNCSPAYVDGRIYIRGRRHLWAVGKE